MRRHISIETKKLAVDLREKGGSIGAIAKKMGVSKSTAYEWTKNIKGAARFAEIGRKRWIKEIQPLGAQAQRKKRKLLIDQIAEDVTHEIADISVTMDMQKAMLAMLYWSEGSKGRGTLSFANTDPRLMLLFITLFRRCFVLDEQKFRLRLHLHWYHKEKEVKRFWSSLLNIPEKKFGKIYRKRRNKEKVFRKNFGGICFLRYNNEHLRERLVHFSYALGESITGKIDVPVVQWIE